MQTRLFVNIHSKEFKQEEGQKVLAAYVKAISRMDDGAKLGRSVTARRHAHLVSGIAVVSKHRLMSAILRKAPRPNAPPARVDVMAQPTHVRHTKACTQQ